MNKYIMLLILNFFFISKPLKANLFILSFGDSLTEGYVGDKSFPIAVAMIPYSKIIEQKLSKKIPFLEVIQKGKGGETSDRMEFRLEDTYTSLKTTSRKPHYVILWAGSNDLRKNRNAHQIIMNLTNMYNFIKNQGAHIIAITIPETNDRSNIKSNSHRHVINQFIRNESKKDSQITLYDANKKFPFHSKYYSDHMHFNQKTYEKIGSDISNIVLSLYKQNQKEEKTRKKSLSQ